MGAGRLLSKENVSNKHIGVVGTGQGLSDPGEQGVCTGPQEARTERVEVVEQGRRKGRKGPLRMSSRGRQTTRVVGLGNMV